MNPCYSYINNRDLILGEKITHYLFKTLPFSSLYYYMYEYGHLII